MSNQETYKVVLQVNALSHAYHGKTILDKINLSVSPGEMVGIIGPNGAGKSSLLKLLSRISPADHGELTLCGSPYYKVPLKDFSQQVSYLPQRPEIYWPLSVETVVALGRLPHHGLSNKLTPEDNIAIDHALDATGINHLRHRPCNMLSEGERMLTSLARVMATQANIILADEPVASLDPAYQLRILDLLSEHTRSNSRHAVILVLHDLNMAARYCDRLVLMQDGRIIDNGSPEKVLTAEQLQTVFKAGFNVQSNPLHVLAEKQLQS